MLFGLANTPSIFQNYMNDVLGPDILNIFSTAYVDNILIYSQTFKEHWNHVKLILSRLQNASLQVDISKCNFEVHEIKYLGLNIQSAIEHGQSGSVSMDIAKTDTIKEWKFPASLKEVQSFIAFANFYHQFIKDFAKLASLLTALTKKNVVFKWEKPEQHTFESIKCHGSGPVAHLAQPSHLGRRCQTVPESAGRFWKILEDSICIVLLSA